MKKIRISWPIRVKTKRLDVRPFETSDYEAWRAGFEHRKVKQHHYDQGPRDPNSLGKVAFKKMILRHTQVARVDNGYVFGLFDRKNGNVVGGIDITTISRSWYQWANLGYWIHNQFQGKGYGKEAARVGLKIAFEWCGYKRVEASINLDNERSLRIAEAVGMKREGIREKYIFENGLWVDHLIYTALNPKREKKYYPMLK